MNNLSRRNLTVATDISSHGHLICKWI